MPEILLEDLITELSSIHRQLNAILFNNELAQIKIAIENNKRQNKALLLGHYNHYDGWMDGNNQQISIWTLALNGNPYQLIGVLVHEMVHQYNAQKGIKDVENNQRHNKKFRDVAVNMAKLYIKPTVRGEKTNNHGKGFAFTSVSDELKCIIDYELDFNRKALEIKHNYALNGDQRGYKERKTYICEGCELTITNSREQDLNLKCLDCNQILKKVLKSIKSSE